MRIMLAIETSQREGSVAICDAHGAVHVEKLHTSRRHDDDLLPAIDRLLHHVHVKPRDIHSVGVSVGPGGFTGLRIAVSTAMMFAEALQAHLVPVPSALVAAEATPHDAAAVLVALAAKADTFWATHVRRCERGNWQVVGEPALMSAAGMQLQKVDLVLAGEHLPTVARVGCEEVGVPVIHPVFSAEACLCVAQQLFSEGCTVDPLRLSPIYPRRPEAVSIWEQRLLGGQ